MQRNILEIDKAFRQELHGISRMSADAVEELLALRGHCLDGGFGACDYFYGR